MVAVNQVAAESTYHVSIPSASVPKAPAGKSSSKVELGPGPLKIPEHRQVFSRHLAPGPVLLPPRETGAKPETLPGDGEFGVAPVVIPGETIGESKS